MRLVPFTEARYRNYLGIESRLEVEGGVFGRLHHVFRTRKTPTGTKMVAPSERLRAKRRGGALRGAIEERVSTDDFLKRGPSHASETEMSKSLDLPQLVGWIWQEGWS